MKKVSKLSLFGVFCAMAIAGMPNMKNVTAKADSTPSLDPTVDVGLNVTINTEVAPADYVVSRFYVNPGSLADGTHIAIRMRSTGSGSWFEISPNLGGDVRTQAKSGALDNKLVDLSGNVTTAGSRTWYLACNLPAAFDGYYCFSKADFTCDGFSNPAATTHNFSEVWALIFHFYQHKGELWNVDIGNIYTCNFNGQGKMEITSTALDWTTLDTTQTCTNDCDLDKLIATRKNVSSFELVKKAVEFDKYDISTDEKISACKTAYESYISGLGTADKALFLNVKSQTGYGTVGEKWETILNIGEAKAAAAATDSLIDAIGTVEYTEASKDLIDAARASYDDLNAKAKEYVTKLDTLTAAEAAYKAFVDADEAAAAEALIDAIGTVTLESKAAIEAARAAFNALSTEAKALVNEAKVSALTTAETAYEALRYSDVLLHGEADLDMIGGVNVKTSSSVTSGWNVADYYINSFESANVSLDEGKYIAVRMRSHNCGSYFEIIPNVNGNARRPFGIQGDTSNNMVVKYVSTDGTITDIVARGWNLQINLPAGVDGWFCFPKEDFTEPYFGNAINWDDTLWAIYFLFYGTAEESIDFDIGNIYNADVKSGKLTLKTRIFSVNDKTNLNYINDKKSTLTYTQLDSELFALASQVDQPGQSIFGINTNSLSICKQVKPLIEALSGAVTEEQVAYLRRVTKNGVNCGDQIDAVYGMIAAESAVADVVTKIEAIGTVEYTDACKALIDTAKAAFDALDEYGLIQISDEAVATLAAAQQSYAALKAADDELEEAADAVVEKINAIGTVAYTDASKAKIDEARTAYDALSEEAKAKVTAAELKVLTDAEARYAQLKSEAEAAAAALAAAKAAGIAEIDEYAASIDMSKYTEENAAQITTLVAEAKAAVNAATSAAEVTSKVAELKAAIEAISVKKGGCKSSISTYSAVISMIAVAGIALLMLRRKQEN